MKRLLANCYLVFFAALSLAALPAQADSRSPASSYDNPSIFPDRGSFQSVSNSRALSQRDVVFRNLLSTEGKDLSWPSFPRTWHEESVSDFLTATATLGFNAGLVGANVAIEYKYVLKSSLIIIAGNRPDDSNARDKNGVTVAPASDQLEMEIFRQDPVSRRTLPNVHKGYPMVAFCAFEATLNYGQTTKGGITFAGSGQTFEKGRLRTVSHTLFSRFFQVDGTMSPLEMLDDVCANKYRKQVEAYVTRDFNWSVVELMAHANPANECQPNPAKDNASGDAACMQWHQQFDRSLRAITVPRCMFSGEGVHKCTLTSRENGNCSMWWDRSQGKAIPSEQTIPRQRYQKATDGPYEFSCDASAGLTCAMVKQPWVAWNAPVWPGLARCVRK